MDNGILKYVLGGLALFLIFLPGIIAETRSRKVLVFAAVLLSVLPVLIMSVSLAGVGIVGIYALPIACLLWIAGLFCGLAAWLDAAQERRNKETTLRLLMNDPRGLGSVEDYLPRRFF